jgi:hypothetical protein
LAIHSQSQGPYEFLDAVYRPLVFHPFSAATGIVLDLQPGFDVLNWCSDEADCPAREHTGNAMAYCRESLAVGVKALFE